MKNVGFSRGMESDVVAVLSLWICSFINLQRIEKIDFCVLDSTYI